MQPMRKVTAWVSRRDLEIAQQYTGKGVSETCRIALEALVKGVPRRKPPSPEVSG